MISPFQTYIKYILIAFLVAIGLGSIWYTRHLGEQLLRMEKNNLELWAKTIEFTSSDPFRDARENLEEASEKVSSSAMSNGAKELVLSAMKQADDELGSASLNFVMSEILLKQRFEIPALITDSDGNVLVSRNVDKDESGPDWKSKFKTDYQPIRIALPLADSTVYQYLYYKDSKLIRMLKYFPFVQLGLVGLVFGLAYLSWSSIRKTEQSNVWVGMAREAAHQLGTPISGLMGWVELIKIYGEENPNLIDIANSLEEDVSRLHSVADRFEKIGSKPELHPENVSSLLNQCAEYLKSRSPLGKNALDISINCADDIVIATNKELFTWGIENILKNALDARNPEQKDFQIAIEVSDNPYDISIEIADTGKGMEKSVQKNVFKAGFSTKKRGWGLGLSLTRRIMEEYHGGTITVLRSELGKGTTFGIVLPKSRSFAS